MSIDKFMASVRSEGLMRTARFEVFFPVPKIFANNKLYSGDMNKILLYCESVNLPGLSLSTTQARTFGEIREIPWEKMFDNVNLSFYLDNSMQIKMFFDNWISNIQDPVTRNFAYYNDYTVDLQIKVFDLINKTKYTVTLYECYPKAIAPINFDMASKDVAKLQVSMNYKYWKSTQDTSTTSPEAQREALGIPKQYFSDFNAFQSSLSSFEGLNISSNAIEGFDTGRGQLIT